MKVIAANLFLIFIPLIIIILTFYLFVGALNREIVVLDVVSKISNIINEVEFYKHEIRNIVYEKFLTDPTITQIEFEAYYVKFEINVIEKFENKIVYEVIAKPIEEIQGIKILIHFIDEKTI